MPKFIKLTSYNEKIKEFYVCTDKIVCFASAKGYEGTSLAFEDGKLEKVMESPESVINLLKSADKEGDVT